MATNFNKPGITDLYTNVLDNIKETIADLAKGLDPATSSSYINTPTNTIRWNSALGYDEKFVGGVWVPKATSYAIVTSGASGGVSDGGVITNPAYTSQVLSNGLSTIDWNVAIGINAYLTLNANKTISIPTNMKEGGMYTLAISTGSGYTIAWNAAYKWPFSTPPDVSATSTITLVTLLFSQGVIRGSYTPGYSV